jgi:hypothetical protein
MNNVNPSKSSDFVIDETTSHSTDVTTSHPTKQSKDDCQVVGYKPASGQVAGYPALRVLLGLKPLTTTAYPSRVQARIQFNPKNPLASSFPRKRESSKKKHSAKRTRTRFCPASRVYSINWIPAFAGMTMFGANGLSGFNKNAGFRVKPGMTALSFVSARLQFISRKWNCARRFTGGFIAAETEISHPL